LKTYLRVLSDEERHRVHESSLNILSHTGVRVDSSQGRQALQEAGADVDENKQVVRLPCSLVEEALRLSPKKFTLGARKPDFKLTMNNDECSLIADGEGTSIIDRKSGQYRPATYQDWLEATRLIDALDDIGVYWTMAHGAEGSGSIPDMVNYWHNLFRNFSKHVQDSPTLVEQIPWLMEVLQVIFGGRDVIRANHPFSFLVCPQSPLVINQQYTDAYLAMTGWDIPAAIMPMPLMGGTAPGNKISTVVLGNCETLAMLTLIQAAAPGTPVIYAPVLAVMNPRTGLYSGGAIENAIMSSAAIEMARYYGLPAEGTGGGTDQYRPGIQAGYERALTSIMPVLSWPDLFVGPGLLGGSMILSMEQILIDIEIYHMNQQAHRGIHAMPEDWLENVIESVGPAGNFLRERSTIQGMRSGAWLVNRLGVHEPFNTWKEAGRPSVTEQSREKVNEILSSHTPLPLSAEIERELERIHKKASISVSG
jgi:trimethylamine:corrinoid methyltransferase-like protein